MRTLLSALSASCRLRSSLQMLVHPGFNSGTGLLMESHTQVVPGSPPRAGGGAAGESISSCFLCSSHTSWGHALALWPRADPVAAGHEALGAGRPCEAARWPLQWDQGPSVLRKLPYLAAVLSFPALPCACASSLERKFVF